MKRIAIAALLFFLAVWAAPAPAQWLASKKPKVNPTQRVPELILIVKTDADERKRVQAAEELREYDTTTFSEITPVLVDVALHDRKPNVRTEALTSLARIRPVSLLAGQTLEKAAAEDEALRVRLHAKAALPKYHFAGYSPRRAEPPTLKKKQTDEPPTVTSSDPTPRFQAPPLGPPTPRPLPPVEGPSLFPK